MIARQKRLEAKRKAEQEAQWAASDANYKPGHGARRSSNANVPGAEEVCKPVARKPKKELIVSCPFCGIHLPKSEMQVHSIEHPALVRAGIYLGGVAHAKDGDTLKGKLKITHVLNCAKELDNYHPKMFKYKKLVLMDRVGQDIMPAFEEAFKFMDTALAAPKGRVFVHCQEGKSRSVSMIAGYLMSRYGFSLNNSLATIASKRRIAAPNKGFREQLERLEANIQKLREAKQEEKDEGPLSDDPP